MNGQRRKRWHRRWFEFTQPISGLETLALGVVVWAIFFGGWQLLRVGNWAPELLLPWPGQVLATLYDLIASEGFLYDIFISVCRIIGSFFLASVVAIPLGVLMGTFSRVEGLFHPFTAAWRYLPAPSFIPLLVMWLGTGEQPKIALLIIGVIWFLITMVMDHTKAVSVELIQTAKTLGGNRLQILWTVIVPAVMPGIFITMRQMLATAWTYLVIAEIVAATTGIGAVMIRAQRFVHVDKIMAGILVIGLLGLIFDFLFRSVHKLLFSYQD